MRSYHARVAAKAQQLEGYPSAEVVRNLRHKADFRDPNARRTDLRFGLWYSLVNYSDAYRETEGMDSPTQYTYKAQAAEPERLGYEAAVETAWDAKYGLFMHWVSDTLEEWDAEVAA